MKVALVYWTWSDNSRYGEDFAEDETEWHYPIDSSALLVPGTTINILDKASGKAVDLTIVRWFYDPNSNLLSLQVLPSENIEIDPDEEFYRYLKENWIKGNAIEDWTKKP